MNSAIAAALITGIFTLASVFLAEALRRKGSRREELDTNNHTGKVNSGQSSADKAEVRGQVLQQLVNVNRTSIADESDYMMASLPQRCLALMIDCIIIWIATLPIRILADMLPDGLDSFSVAVYVLVLGIYSISGWARAGTTPGKRILKLYVASSDGDIGVGFLRATARFLVYLPSLLFFPVLLLPLFNKSGRTLHDFISSTLVVHERG